MKIHTLGAGQFVEFILPAKVHIKLYIIFTAQQKLSGH